MRGVHTTRRSSTPKRLTKTIMRMKYRFSLLSSSAGPDVVGVGCVVTEVLTITLTRATFVISSKLLVSRALVFVDSK